jgi:hypothetical protein
MRYGIAFLGVLCACATTGHDPVDAGPVVDAQPLLPPDATAPVACDPVNQSGCTDALRCTVVGIGDEQRVLTCMGDGGDKAEGESCTPALVGEVDDCQGGLYCSEFMGNVCVAFCDDNPADTCSDGRICSLAMDLDDDNKADLKLCAETCDVHSQDCAQNGHACYPSQAGPTCAPAGGGQTPRQEGETCDFANHCGPGLGCLLVGVQSEFRCFEICDPLQFTSCGDQVCNRVEDETWGICVDSQ